MLIIFPTGGLGNRMRVIDSAIRYCESTKVGCRILWFYHPEMMACHWEDLFLPRHNVHNVKYLYKILVHLNKLRKTSRIFYLFLHFLQYLRILAICWQEDYNDIRQIAATKKYYCFFIIETFSAFFSSDDGSFKKDFFHLNEELLNRVNEETHLFSENTIGVHIRRGDNEESIINSPTELFINEIRDGIKKGNNYYLCSDDENIKTTFLNEFGSKAIITPSGRGISRRDTTEGIKQATVELFALSRCSKIIGSYYSSFSDMASCLGGKELKTIRTTT